MSNMGNAMMGSGEAEGENRALRAAESALANPLLGDISIKVRCACCCIGVGAR